MTRWWKAHRLRRRLNRPTPAVQQIVRRLRSHLEAAPGSALALIEIGSADAAAVAMATLAGLLASEGQQVVLADAADDRPLATLLGASRPVGSIGATSIKGQPVGLYVAPADPSHMADQDAGEDADVVLVLATVNPGIGADHIAAWVGDAVVMVRAGHATPGRIDGIAKQLRNARIMIRAGLLIDTDSGDHTSGVLPSRPYTTSDTADLLLDALRVSGP